MSGLYLGLAETGAGGGVDGDAAAAPVTFHSDGDVGKTTASFAFCSCPHQHWQQQHHGDSAHHRLQVSTQGDM